MRLVVIADGEHVTRLAVRICVISKDLCGRNIARSNIKLGPPSGPRRFDAAATPDDR